MALAYMNRAMRRLPTSAKQKFDALEEYNIKKKLQKEVITGLKGDIDKIKLDLTKELMTKITVAMVVSIHDTYNFKHKRLQRVLDKAMNLFECIDAGTVTLEDLTDWVKDELKIEL